MSPEGYAAFTKLAEALVMVVTAEGRVGDRPERRGRRSVNGNGGLGERLRRSHQGQARCDGHDVRHVRRLCAEAVSCHRVRAVGVRRGEITWPLTASAVRTFRVGQGQAGGPFGKALT